MNEKKIRICPNCGAKVKGTITQFANQIVCPKCKKRSFFANEAASGIISSMDIKKTRLKSSINNNKSYYSQCIVSLVVAILGLLIPILSIAGLILGIRILRKMKNPSICRDGRGMATASVVISSIVLVLVCIGILLFTPMFGPSKNALKIARKSNLESLHWQVWVDMKLHEMKDLPVSLSKMNGIFEFPSTGDYKYISKIPGTEAYYTALPFPEGSLIKARENSEKSMVLESSKFDSNYIYAIEKPNLNDNGIFVLNASGRIQFLPLSPKEQREFYNALVERNKTMLDKYRNQGIRFSN